MKIIVTMSPGNNPSPDILVDSLCTTQSIGINKGRTYLYDNGFNKLIYTIDFKIPKEFICGDVLAFYDPDYGIEIRGRISGWSQSCSVDANGRLVYSQTVIVEKDIVEI